MINLLRLNTFYFSSATGSDLFNSKFIGVRSLLGSLETSQLKHSTWVGIDSPRTIKTYSSPQRELLLMLCGWDKKRTQRNLNEISRNAAIAIFNLDLKSSLEILKSGCAAARAKVVEEPV